MREKTFNSSFVPIPYLRREKNSETSHGMENVNAGAMELAMYMRKYIEMVFICAVLPAETLHNTVWNACLLRRPEEEPTNKLLKKNILYPQISMGTPPSYSAHLNNLLSNFHSVLHLSHIIIN